MAFARIRQLFDRRVGGLQDGMADLREDMAAGGLGWRLALWGLVVYLLLTVVVAFYWSNEPARFAVRDTAAEMVDAQGQRLVTGAVTTATMIRVVDTLLEKRGGFISNDLLPPGALLDNLPNWEYGVLIQVRDLSKAMREAFSRSQSQSQENPLLAKAESRFNFDHSSWAVPASESEYADATQFLRRYLQSLASSTDSDVQFYARADNLRYWLSTVESRLGSLSQRLSASVGQRRINTDLAGDVNASQATHAPGELQVKTPWREIDDVFYVARGSTWALLHFLKAVEVDFSDILVSKNALVSLRQIIRELEATQQPVASPMIFNGDGFGVLANHSLVMASYISRAHAALIDLRELLSQG